MLDKNDRSRKYVARFYQRWSENITVAVFLNQVGRMEAFVPRMPRRLVLIPAVLAVLTIMQPWSPASHAEGLGGSAATPAAASAAPLPIVLAIDLLKSEAGTQITISGEGNLAYEYFVIGGKSLLIDIPGASSKVLPAERLVDDGFVSRIQVAEHTGEKPGVRIALALKKPDDFTVRGENGRIVVLFATRKDSASPSQPPLNRVVEVTAARIANAFRVAVKTDTKPAYRVLESGDPKKITIAIDRARLETNSRTTSEYPGLDSPVTRISSWTEPGDPAVVLVAVDLRQPLPFRVFTDEYGLNVDFKGAVSGGTESVPLLPLSPAGTPGSTLPDLPVAAVAATASVSGKYSGKKITLEFQDADITDIFRLIADVSGMNIVATDDVKGKRSVKMSEVPWDQALDLILKTNIPPLARVIESDTVIRVTTMQRMVDDKNVLEKRKLESQMLAEKLRRDELESGKRNQIYLREAERDRKRQEIFAPGLVDKTFMISYADINTIRTSIQKLVLEYNKTFTASGDFQSVQVGDAGKAAAAQEAERRQGTPAAVDRSMSQMSYESCPGCVVELDPRTNTIFIRTYPYYLEQFTAVITALDKPTPAVLVEARIVRVTSANDLALGIQWGAKFSADAAHGNALPYAFPNSVAVNGTQGVGNYLVNLPLAGATGGVGISLGHIANVFSLDLKLSAMEQLGKAKLLSNPKLLVMQGKPANIQIGQDLPMITTTTDSNGAQTSSTEWRAVGIMLKVTPMVTNDKRIGLTVEIEQSTQGEDVTTTEGDNFSINVNRVVTEVLIEDGSTAVIGGLLEQENRDSSNGVPGFSNIPVIGWLFKTKSNSTRAREILVFLTPKIVVSTP